MLTEEYERIDPGHKGRMITVNLEAVDFCAPHIVTEKTRPNNTETQTEIKGEVVLVMRCGVVLLLKGDYKSINQKMKAYHPGR